MAARAALRPLDTITLSTARLFILLHTVFLLGCSITSAIFLLWAHHSDPVLSTAHLPHYHGNAPINSVASVKNVPDITPITKDEISKRPIPTSTDALDRISCPPAGSITCCQPSIQSPPDKIDIVIPYEYRDETDISLKYELRSFEKSGLLDHVGKVYIIAENAGNATLIKQRYQKYIAEMTNNKDSTPLRIISMDDIKVPFNVKKYKENVKLAKSHYSPFLPGIAEYYLLVPDDIVMLRNYTRDVWFNKARSLPYAHGFGSWRGGNTNGFPNIAELHGVNFLNRCTMQYVIEKHNADDPAKISPTAVAIGMMNKEKMLAGFYRYNAKEFEKIGPHKAKFFVECHTNGGCKTPRDFKEIFVNIQGKGISVEYGEPAKKEKDRWMDWFDKHFPLPSRFE